MTEHYCSIHKAKLVEDSVPILYGTFAPEPEHVIQERIGTYPFANAFVLGPCWVESTTHKNVLFCPVCREKWLDTHEAHQLAEHLAQDKPTLEQEIELLRAQQTRNTQYALIYYLVRVAGYTIIGIVIGTAASYFLSNGQAFGAALGGVGGATIGALITRRMA